MEETKKMYIGSKEIKAVFGEGGPIIGVVLEDDSKMEFTPEQYKSVVKEEKYSDGDVSTNKWELTVNSILKILLDNRLHLGEKDFVLNLIDNSIVFSYNRAIGKLFNVNHPHNVSIADLNNVLITNATINYDEIKKEGKEVAKETDSEEVSEEV